VAANGTFRVGGEQHEGGAVRLSGISDIPTATGESRRPRRLLHLIARRGDSHGFPENTLPALRSALALGARFIEIDVHLSADGTPLVIRDEMLTHRAVTDIPTLADVLGLLEGHPEITLFVMLGRASVLRFGHEQVVTRVARALRPFRSQCILGSMDLPAAHAARVLAGYPIAWIVPGYDGHIRLKYEALQPEYVFCDRRYLPATGALWRGPWRWAITEVESLEETLALAQRGADFVASPHVKSLGEAMLSHSATITQSRLEAILTGSKQS
jgi:glycerophosphoryl diester phosphodiesterase